MSRFIALVVLTTFLACEVQQAKASEVVLSEFMASNSRTLADEDGAFEDWIELWNSGAEAINLSGWSLTDDPGDLTKWRFPATILAPGGFLVVFASGKDRTVVESNLHTNFRLASDGEYLALVEADGVTIASEFNPQYPKQAQDVSFGFGLRLVSDFLVQTGSATRVFVPIDDALEARWREESFDPSEWLPALNGVGYDTGVPDPAEDSYADAILSSAPLGWWRLDETAGTTFSNRGSLGQIAAATNVNLALSQPGPRPPLFGGFESDNKAPRFNSFSGRMRVPDHPAFDFGSGPFAIEMWFNPANASTRGDLFTYKGTGGDFGIHVASQGANTLSVFHDAFIGTGGGISNGIWYHLVVTRASGVLTAYVNGRVLFTGSDSAQLSVANDLLIGSDHAGNPASASLYFSGLIDEVAIYNRALPESEALAHYQGALSGGASYVGKFQTDLQTAMFGLNSSVYVRIPFNVADLAALDRLLLRVNYDDGFVAWINGVEITSRNAPTNLTWNSAATARHADSEAAEPEDFEVGDFRDFVHAGQNVLALQGLNISPDNGDFLLTVELIGTDIGDLNPSPRYFLQPTPGSANGVGATDLGPLISEVQSSPALPLRPTDDDDIQVTARIEAAFAPIASVTLQYRVMFGASNTIPLLDDGLNGDGAAGDGVYGASIPASASTPGQMVRWQVRASDDTGKQSRWPLFEDPLNSPEYLGTVVTNSAVTSALPIWEWFAANTTAANTEAGTRGAVLYNGEFFDNVQIRRRGGATSIPSQKFDFNTGYHPFINSEVGRVEEANLNGSQSDSTLIRPAMAFETFRTAGNPGSFAFPVLMRANGGPDAGRPSSVAYFVEQVDTRYLSRFGLDPNGALYKFVQRGSLNPIFTEPNDGVEKKTRLEEDRADLQALCTALQLTNNPTELAQRTAFLFDNVNLPALMNHLACRAVTLDSDDVRKNIYLHRDTLGNGEWTILPWDKDWTFGILGDGGTFLRHPFFGDRIHRKDNALQWSLLYEAVFTEPKLAGMYLRRLRTVMDQQLQPPGTPLAESYFAARASAWYAPLFPHLPGASNEVNAIRTVHVPARRTDLYVKYAATNSAEGVTNRLVPNTQPANAIVQISSVEFNPASGKQSEEFICLTNPAAFAMDISGWQIGGAVQHTFTPGTVILSHDVMYVSPDVTAFRLRTNGPRGGQSLLVQGNYQGQLSARGESVQLLDSFGRTVDVSEYPGAPSDAQRFLRITEIQYHPVALPPDPDPEKFEFIELKNTGPTPLELTGVRFISGIEFTFAATGPVTSLGSGETVLLVRDREAFTNRFGNGLPIAGQYTGALENRGERIQLVDATGEEILDFSYDNAWYPITDGFGFSLVINDESAEPDQWSNPAQWRPSGKLDGSPGADEMPAPEIPTVLVNEVLSRTDAPPPTDSIELFNPGSNNADIGGWFLTDDFNTPKKFRIPDNTIIPAGGYLVFDESHFNPGGNGFALSSDSDETFLFSANPLGDLTGYFHGFNFGAADDGVSFGRQVSSDGREHFVAQSSTSLGATNAGPRVGPVIISEIYFHPPDLAGNEDNAADEFVELQNISPAAVALYDPAAPSNVWRLSGGVDFTFPTNVTLQAGEFLLLVNFDPADPIALQAFQSRNHPDPGVRLLGPYSGKLDNSADDVELKRPGTPLPSGVPDVLLDKVEYLDHLPWPAGADGTGLSLQRTSLSSYGNDPAHWTALPPTPGVGTVIVGARPVISRQPASQTVVAYTDITLSVAASGSTPLSYQWRHQGVPLQAATNSVLFLPNFQPRDGGDYDVLIYNPAGSVLSDSATLGVLLAADILAQPQDVMVRPGSNATFSVLAYSPSPITYQWQFNGSPIAGATEPNFAVTSVDITNAGRYSVVLTDSVGAIASRGAELIVLIDPLFLQQPLPASVPAGSSVTLSATVTNTATLPLTFRWRRNGTTAFTETVEGYSSFVVVTNVQGSNGWDVVVGNLARPSGILSSRARVVGIPDSDGDGIPDSWEIENGLNLQDPNDAEMDSDGDSFRNRDEYLAGTDPRDGDSYLKIESIHGGVPLLEFIAVSNLTYSVQFSDALAAGVWNSLADIAARPTNHTEIVIDPSSKANRFYRLATPRQAD